MKNQFDCKEGFPICIPDEWVCDGQGECLDNADESAAACGEPFFTCGEVKMVNNLLQFGKFGCKGTINANTQIYTKNNLAKEIDLHQCRIRFVGLSCPMGMRSDGNFYRFHL